MDQFMITIWFDNKKQKVLFPDFFEKRGFRIRYTKKQFDYLKEECYDQDACFFDFKKKKIYFHEWCEPALTGDCDYAWSSPYDYSHKIFDMYKIGA